MSKVLKSSILIFILAGLLVPIGFSIIGSNHGVGSNTVYAEHECPNGEQPYHTPTGDDCVPRIPPAEGLAAAAGGSRGDTEVGCDALDFWCKIRKGVAYTMLTFAGWLLWIAGLFFDFSITLTVKNMALFLNEINGIDVAWRVLRDIVNMVFIFAILYIAVATILRIEEYGAKRLLARLIFIALLINFSLFFTKVVIDVSNVLTNEFVVGIEELSKDVTLQIPSGQQTTDPRKFQNSISGAFVEPLRLTTLYNSAGGAALGQVNDDNLFTIGLYGSLFLLVAAFIFFAGAILLMIRFIVFIFLMVSSPIAFAAMILPKTQEYAKQWWQQLFKYAIFAPVYMALLLAVAVIVNDQTFQNSLSTAAGIDPLQGGQGYALTFAGLLTGEGSTIVVVLNFLIVTGLMVSALIAAQKMGVGGASAVANLGTRSASWLGRRGVGFAGRKWNEWTQEYILNRGKGQRSAVRKGFYAVLNPVGVARGWEQRRKELDELAASGAAARGRMVAEQFLTSPVFSPSQWLDAEAWKRGGQLQIDYGVMDDRSDENKFMDDYTGMRKESLMHAAVQVKDMGGDEGGLRRRAIVKAAATQGYLDDLLRMRVFAEKYGEADGTIYDAKTLNRFLVDYLGEDHSAMRFMAEDMEDLGRRTGHYEYMGHAYFDPETGKFERGFKVVEEGGEENFAGNKIDVLENHWQAGYASGEVAKVSGRERLRIAPHNFTSIRAKLDEEGNMLDKGEEIKDHIAYGSKDGKLDDFYKAMLGAIDEGDYRELHHSQSRTPKWLLSYGLDKSTGELIVENEDDVKKIEALYKEKPEYIRGLYGKFFGMTYDRARENLPGIKVAYYKKDGDAVRKVQSKIRIGNSAGVEHPVIGVVTDGFMKDPNVKFGQFGKTGKEKIEKVLKGNLKKIFGGKKNREDLQAQFADKLRNEEFPEDITPDKLAEEVYETMRRTLKDNYSPVPIFEKINESLPDKQKLSIKEMSKMSRELPDKYADTWKSIAENAQDMDSDDVVQKFRSAFETTIRAVSDDVFNKVNSVGGIDLLVEQIRPTKRVRNMGGEEQEEQNA